MYYKDLLNMDYTSKLNNEVEPNKGSDNKISKIEVKTTSTKMKKKKALGARWDTYRNRI